MKSPREGNVLASFLFAPGRKHEIPKLKEKSYGNDEEAFLLLSPTPQCQRITLFYQKYNEDNVGHVKLSCVA